MNNDDKITIVIIIAAVIFVVGVGIMLVKLPKHPQEQTTIEVWKSDNQIWCEENGGTFWLEIFNSHCVWPPTE